MKIAEVLTSLGQEYQRLYTQYYKKAHYKARKQGLTGREADQYAERALDAYKDRVRSGKHDPITGQAGVTTYQVSK